MRDSSLSICVTDKEDMQDASGKYSNLISNRVHYLMKYMTTYESKLA